MIIDLISKFLEYFTRIMQKTEVDTSETLNYEYNIPISTKQFIINYGIQHDPRNFLATLLGSININGDTDIDQINEKTQKLVENLEFQCSNIERYEKDVIKSYDIQTKILTINRIFEIQNDSKVQQNQQLYVSQKPCKDKFFFDIDKIEKFMEKTISKIKCWREMKKERLVEMNRRQIKINKLLLNIYNRKNYIEQLSIVKGLVQSIKSKMSQTPLNYAGLEQLLSKQMIPYYFYQNYILSKTLECILIKIANGELILMKNHAYNQEIMAKIRSAIFQNSKASLLISQKCSKLLQFNKYIRIIDKTTEQMIEKGFIKHFSRLFVTSICNQQSIDKIDIIKSKSIMQSSQQTIQLWKQFEEIKTQQYFLWYYKQISIAQSSSVLNTIAMKKNMQTFKLKYQWIELLDLKQSQNKLNFCSNYFKIILKRLIFPVLVKINSNFVQVENKKKSQHQSQMNRYLNYFIFQKYTNLFQFLCSNRYLDIFQNPKYSKDWQTASNELHLNEYFNYYSEIITYLLRQHLSTSLALQFQQLWKQLQFQCCFIEDIKLENVLSRFDGEQFYQIRRLYAFQDELKKLIANKKQYKSEEGQEQLYNLLMKLNFKTKNFNLLQKAIKLLSSKVQKQISIIRSLAYKRLES